MAKKNKKTKNNQHKWQTTNPQVDLEMYKNAIYSYNNEKNGPDSFAFHS